jgi:hypothetical protein
MATKPTGRPHGGARAGAGRPRGSRSRTYRPHAQIEKLAAADGLTPRDVVLSVMRWHYQEKRYDAAVAVAEKVAVYVHPRLSATALSAPPSLRELIFSASGAELAEAAEQADLAADLAEADLARAKPKGRA